MCMCNYRQIMVRKIKRVRREIERIVIERKRKKEYLCEIEREIEKIK